MAILMNQLPNFSGMPQNGIQFGWFLLAVAIGDYSCKYKVRRTAGVTSSFTPNPRIN